MCNKGKFGQLNLRLDDLSISNKGAHYSFALYFDAFI